MTLIKARPPETYKAYRPDGSGYNLRIHPTWPACSVRAKIYGKGLTGAMPIFRGLRFTTPNSLS